MKRFFKKYATFSGRASRSEYWWWALVSFAVSAIVNIFVAAGSAASAAASSYGSSQEMGPGAIIGAILLVIFALATVIPSLALTVRRLHDGNFSGWLLLLGLVPFAGGLALLVLVILPSTASFGRGWQSANDPSMRGDHSSRLSPVSITASASSPSVMSLSSTLTVPRLPAIRSRPDSACARASDWIRPQQPGCFLAQNGLAPSGRTGDR